MLGIIQEHFIPNPSKSTKNIILIDFLHSKLTYALPYQYSKVLSNNIENRYKVSKRNLFKCENNEQTFTETTKYPLTHTISPFLTGNLKNKIIISNTDIITKRQIYDQSSSNVALHQQIWPSIQSDMATFNCNSFD